MFHVGQQIECINDDWYGDADLPLEMLNYAIALPQKGARYTVRSVNSTDFNEPYLRVAELINPMPPVPFDEVHFRCACFRPIVETSISIFTEMLTPARQTEKV